MIIHFLGGIHEIYFPYVLAHPIMLPGHDRRWFPLRFVVCDYSAGLVATPSPGSISLTWQSSRPDSTFKC